jgi:hypothetical protein
MHTQILHRSVRNTSRAVEYGTLDEDQDARTANAVAEVHPTSTIKENGASHEISGAGGPTARCFGIASGINISGRVTKKHAEIPRRHRHTARESAKGSLATTPWHL